MLNKRLIQVLLISAALVLVIISLIYVKNTRENLSSNDNVKINTLKNDSNNNIIENISYISEDTDGNRFEIRARVGELDNDKPEIIEIETLDVSKITNVLYANSITLTPGTLTLDVDKNKMKIHTLDVVFKQSLLTQEMAKKVDVIDGRLNDRS